MKIIILGAGYVGTELATYLANSGHAVTLVDTPSAELDRIALRIDLRVVQGNPSSPVVLRNAGAENTELLVAATADDEVNITACSIGAFLFHIPRRIARIRSSDYLQEADEIFGDHGIPIDHVICPEHIATDDITRLIDLPGASAVSVFFYGMLTVVSAKCQLNGKLIGHAYSEFESYENKAALLSVFRNGKYLDGFRREFIAPDDDRLYGSEVEIYNADPTSLEFMNEEQLQRSDIFIAASPSDESNIMASMLMHRLHNVRTMAIIRGEGYNRLAENTASEIDTVVTPNEATVSALLSNIRQEGVENMRLFRRGQSEAVELVIEGSHFSSRVIGRKPAELSLPSGTNMGLVLRNERVIRPDDNFKFQEGDHALFFLNDQKQVRKLIRYFRPRAFWIPKW